MSWRHGHGLPGRGPKTPSQGGGEGTATGLSLGTLAYMSPEQVAGAREGSTTRRTGREWELWSSGENELARSGDQLRLEATQMGIILLVAILVVLLGILTALKNGFNQVIKGLESIDERISTGPPAA